MLGRLRGVATGWTGVGMSTPLLPEAVPEIDANPLSLFGGAREGKGIVATNLFTQIYFTYTSHGAHHAPTTLRWVTRIVQIR